MAASKDEMARLEAENQQLKAEVTELRKETIQLKDALVRMVNRNLDLSERLEKDDELRRRVEVAREDVCLDLYDTVYDTERQMIYLTRR